jgi:outer membrane protein assembly factor BamD (BamD/ComL family)
MNRMHSLRSVLCAALLLGATASFEAQAQGKGDAVSPAVGKPLQEAQALAKSGRYREAMAKISEAEAAAKGPNETLVVQRMRASVASTGGDNDAAVKSYEALLNSGRVTGRDATQMVQAVAVAYYKNKEYAKAAQWSQRYFKDGGTDPAMRTVLLQSYYLGNDCASVNRMLGSAAAEDSTRKPSEEDLQILANCFLRQKDTGGYVSAIEKLVVFYPKKEYWTDLLSRVQKKPGFSDRLALSVYRLKLATGNLSNANDYMEAAQLAVQAGVPAEAKAILDKGYAANVLGQGKEGERHGRLRDLVGRNLEESKKNRAQDEREALAAKDGNDLVKVGLNYVYEGNPQKGLQLIEQGIKKGGLKRPEDAKLRLGEAQLQSGQKSKGVQTLRDVKGADGTADIARLWVLHARV